MNNTATAQADAQFDVLAIDPEAVDHLWVVIEPYIQRGLDYGYDAYELPDIKQRLKDRKLVGIAVMRRGVSLPVVVLTLELSTIQNIGRVCHYVTAGGAEMETWAEWLDPIICEIAREQGAEYLTTKGRPGWARALRSLGYEHLYTICGKKVTP